MENKEKDQEVLHDAVDEINSLNEVENLDVEELERRLELVSGLGAYPCGVVWGY